MGGEVPVLIHEPILQAILKKKPKPRKLLNWVSQSANGAPTGQPNWVPIGVEAGQPDGYWLGEPKSRGLKRCPREVLITSKFDFSFVDYNVYKTLITILRAIYIL